MNNKGQIGFGWILALFLLFVLGLIFIVTNQVLVNHVLPESDKLIENSNYLNESEINATKDKNDKFMDYWNTLPYIIVSLIAVFLVIMGIRGMFGGEQQ